MKLKYLLTALLASSFAFIGCEDEKVGYLDNIKLSESYMSMPVNGGKITLDIDANVDWEFVTNDNWPDVITRDKTGEIKSQTPSWLAADAMSGKAGKSTVTFTAAESAGGREIELTIKAGASKQFIRVRQGSLTAVTVSCKEANESPVGKNVKVKVPAHPSRTQLTETGILQTTPVHFISMVPSTRRVLRRTSQASESKSVTSSNLKDLSVSIKAQSRLSMLPYSASRSLS